MAQQEYWHGSTGPYLYEDTDTYPDAELLRAFRGLQAFFENAPAADEEVVRKLELDDLASFIDETALQGALSLAMTLYDNHAAFADDFSDETGVDAGSSSFYAYNATNDYFYPSGGDMTLQSAAQASDFKAYSIRCFLLEQDVDAITLNTDLKLYVSADGGANFDQVTLTSIASFYGNKRLLTGAVTISNQGSSLVWKVTTHNSKVANLYGVVVAWKQED